MPKTDRSRPVTEAALDRLGAWAARKPRVALMGEFSAGKSTLLNLLLGEELLPTRVTATELPPVWFSHGAPRAFWMDKAGRSHPLDFGSFAGVPRSARCVRVFAPLPLLERCDILDTPGISDPNLDEESWRFPVGQANLVLWCTPATQAWRETERSTWLSLPERLRAQSLVVVTRADKLGPLDREKVARRVGRETAGHFAGLVLLSSLDALHGRAELARTGDATLWQASGGAELAARLDLALTAARAARGRLLRRYHLGDAPRTDEVVPFRPAAPPEPVRPRRVELPESRRSERPEVDAPDALRAGWRAIRPPAPEPTPVLRLHDPEPVLRRPEPVLHVPVLPESVLHVPEPEPEPAPVLRLPDPPPAPVLHLADPLPRFEEEPAAFAPEAPPPEEPAAVEEAPAEEPLPRAVRIWRDIVARSTQMPPDSPVLDMIDQLLCELSRDDELSDGTGRGSATIIARNQAA